MQADRQGELGTTKAFHRQFSKLGKGAGHAHRAHRDATLTDAEVIVEASNRLQNRLNVEEWLPHAHEHHVGWATIHHLADAEHLIDNFMGGERALQPPLPSGAETTGHGASHLTGDAHREALIRGDTNRFDGFGILGAEKELGGGIARNGTQLLLQPAHHNALILQSRSPSLGQDRDAA